MIIKRAEHRLQTEINSDEEFKKFMKREGLLVIDVYAEWCGPCVSMIGTLEKIKSERGGENLQLAVCKSDAVQCLKRFRNKSEPTWLLASQNKIVNCVFGANVPALVHAIDKELLAEENHKTGKCERKFYEWTELTPHEQARKNEDNGFNVQYLKMHAGNEISVNGIFNKKNRQNYATKGGVKLVNVPL